VSDATEVDDTPATDGVVRLVTAQEREAEAEAELRHDILEEAIGMLEHAAEIFEAHGVAGVAIAFALEDGSYGRILPTRCSNVPGLIGAVATMQQDLILRTLVDDE